MTNGATIGAHYNGVLGGASQSHAVKGNVAFSFSPWAAGDPGRHFFRNSK